MISGTAKRIMKSRHEAKIGTLCRSKEKSCYDDSNRSRKSYFYFMLSLDGKELTDMSIPNYGNLCYIKDPKF